jgi:flagellar protein FliL
MATAAPAAEVAAPKGGGKKKLMLIIAIVLVLLIGGGAAVFLLKKKAPPAEGEEGYDEEASPKTVEVAKPKPGTPPVYLPMDPFTVNLADKDTDRFAQVGVTLEVTDQKTADMIKGYMPAIRSGVLVVLSHKTAAQMLSKEGKERLQQEVLAEAVRPLGFEVELEPEPSADAAADEETKPVKKKKKKKKAEVLPVTQVLFSQFIVQ